MTAQMEKIDRFLSDYSKLIVTALSGTLALTITLAVIILNMVFADIREIKTDMRIFRQTADNNRAEIKVLFTNQVAIKDKLMSNTQKYDDNFKQQEIDIREFYKKYGQSLERLANQDNHRGGTPISTKKLK